MKVDLHQFFIDKMSNRRHKIVVYIKIFLIFLCLYKIITHPDPGEDPYPQHWKKRTVTRRVMMVCDASDMRQKVGFKESSQLVQLLQDKRSVSQYHRDYSSKECKELNLKSTRLF